MVIRTLEFEKGTLHNGCYRYKSRFIYKYIYNGTTEYIPDITPMKLSHIGPTSADVYM